MNSSTPGLAALVLIPLVAGPLAALAGARVGGRAAAWSAALIVALTGAIALSLAPDLFRGMIWTWRIAWVPEAGLDIALRMDGLSFLFVLLIIGIGLLIVLYARYYMDESDRLGRFYALLLAFMAAMLGIALADNLLLLLVFWELTGVTSFLLIGYWGARADARRGARTAITVTSAGGLAMMAGFLLLGEMAGTYEISALNLSGDDIREHPLYAPMLLLVLAGAFTKSAQFPFHFWLPQAMAAPTPVSAYLHSATMVKAGIFLIARLHPAVGQTELFEYVVSGVGLFTMVFAAYGAVFRHDLKGLLAYSTISHLGMIVFLLGLDTPLSALAAVFHIVNHATFKASLFMAAGVIDHEAGTRDMRRLAGLWKPLPYTASLAIVAAAAMAGVPLLNGFLSKELFFAESLQLGRLGLFGEIAPYVVVVGAALSVAYSMRFIHDVFFNGEPRNLPRAPHEPPRWMKFPIEILVAVCVLVGLFPGLTVQPLVDLAGEAVYGSRLPAHEIAIFHGFNLPLAMTVLALSLGGFFYWMLQKHFELHLHVPSRWNAALVFTHLMGRLLRGARAATRLLGTGPVHRSVFVFMAIALLLGLAAFADAPFSLGPVRTDAGLFAWVLWALLACAALGTVVFERQRVIAVLFVAVAGLVVTMGFIHFSAPDLALTQVCVEVVTTVLLLMALALLPRETPHEPGAARKFRDAVLAGGVGLGTTALAWSVMTRPAHDFSRYFIEKAPSEAGGLNVVNVILVDFRGFDTLGEITVLAVAALGVAALMTGLKVERTESGLTRDRYPLMFAAAANVMLPFTLLVAAYLFLRGHNLPGGGFIAGLLTAIALITQFMSDGFEVTERRLGVHPARLIGVGLAIAAATGYGAWFFGAPYLTSAHGHPHFPLIGDVPISSAVAFDLGVYIVVVGAAVLSLSALAHASRRTGTQ